MIKVQTSRFELEKLILTNGASTENTTPQYGIRGNGKLHERNTHPRDLKNSGNGWKIHRKAQDRAWGRRA